MLRLDFINVGDGDAILIREYSGGSLIFTLLMDCGLAEVIPQAGSRRQSAADYLKEQNVTKIDLLVITHLHPDHAGGMAQLFGVTIDRMLSGYLPLCEKESVIGAPPPGSSASVRGMYRSLTLFVQNVARLRDLGCDCGLAAAGIQQLTPNMTMQTVLADRDMLRRQAAVFAAIEEGRELSEETLLRVSKERNPASLRVSLRYAGRRILLPGDAYGAYWENEPDASPCDIFKVPHHGDGKSLTLPLISKLRPAFAIVSSLAGDETKHRPDAVTLMLLRQFAGQLILLENDAACGLEPASLKSAVLCILKDGKIQQEPLDSPPTLEMTIERRHER